MQMIRKFFLALWCLSLASLALAEGQSIDGIAAIVNKSIITQSQLHQQMNLYRQQLQQQNSPIPEAAVLKEKVLDGLIAIQLQLQMAKKLNINVTDSEVTEAIAKIASQNHLSVAQMREALARQGMSFASYRAQIKKQMILSAVQHQVLAPKIAVSPEEAKRYAASVAHSQITREYRLKALMIPLPNAADNATINQAQEKALEIMGRLDAGADFEALHDETFAGQPLKFGDLGWRGASSLPPSLVAILQKSKPGAVVGPMRTDTGIYIMRYLEGRNRALSPNGDPKQLLYQHKYEALVQAWVKKLRAESFIKITD